MRSSIKGRLQVPKVKVHEARFRRFREVAEGAAIPEAAS